jgi:hypothetical protein
MAIFGLVIAAAAIQGVSAEQIVQKTGLSNGKACAVSIRVEDNGFVTGISLSGLGVRSQLGGARAYAQVLSNLMDEGRFASMGFFQAPMIATEGTVLNSYYDTSLVTAEQTTINIYGDLRDPVSVGLSYSHLEGPIVKAPVTHDELSCLNLK